jgi:hypothetical protein
MLIKKVLILVLIIAVLSVSLFGCNGLSATQKYLKAMNNISKIDSYESLSILNINFDLDEASKEDKKNLNDIKKISLNMDTKYSNGDFIQEIFFDSNEMVMDNTIYVFDNKAYLKSSFTDEKYMDLNEYNFEEENEEDKNLTEDVYSIWKDSIENEIMEEEGNSIITTPDGDIKVNQVSLSLNDKKVKKIIKEIVKLIDENDSLKDSVISSIKTYSDSKSDEENFESWFENLSETLDKYEDNIEINKLTLNAKYNKDNYILEQSFEGEIIIKNDGVIKVDFDYSMKNWNINKDVNLDIPDIKDNDIISPEGVDFSELY